MENANLRTVRVFSMRGTESKLLISDEWKRTNEIQAMCHTNEYRIFRLFFLFFVSYQQFGWLFAIHTIQLDTERRKFCKRLRFDREYLCTQDTCTHARVTQWILFSLYLIEEIQHIRTLSCITTIASRQSFAQTHTHSLTHTASTWCWLYYQNNKRWYKHIVILSIRKLNSRRCDTLRETSNGIYSECIWFCPLVNCAINRRLFCSVSRRENLKWTKSLAKKCDPCSVGVRLMYAVHLNFASLQLTSLKLCTRR